jgi:carbon monoxide dehydrogenase subunit G
MIQFEGDRHFSLKPEIVVDRLSNAAFLVGCLKNVEQVVEATPDRAVWKLRTGFSFLSATLEITLNVTERAQGRTSFEAISRGVGATSVVRAVLTFTPIDVGTTVHYVAEVAERTGLLKIISAGLIQAAAKNVIEDTWQAIEAKLAEVERG